MPDNPVGNIGKSAQSGWTHPFRTAAPESGIATLPDLHAKARNPWAGSEILGMLHLCSRRIMLTSYSKQNLVYCWCDTCRLLIHCCIADSKQKLSLTNRCDTCRLLLHCFKAVHEHTALELYLQRGLCVQQNA
jgi:hypothetical protein